MAPQRTTTEKAERYEVMSPLLEAMFAEFKELSKKKPEGPISSQKIKVVNRLLESCREVLETEDSINFLDVIDEDDVPQNSDVVLMLSQYVAAMSTFKSKYYGFTSGLGHDWFT